MIAGISLGIFSTVWSFLQIFKFCKPLTFSDCLCSHCFFAKCGRGGIVQTIRSCNLHHIFLCKHLVLIGRLYKGKGTYFLHLGDSNGWKAGILFDFLLNIEYLITLWLTMFKCDRCEFTCSWISQLKSRRTNFHYANFGNSTISTLLMKAIHLLFMWFHTKMTIIVHLNHSNKHED